MATPIGNARDLTLRALDLLGGVDRVICEDTRVTAKLLTLHGISKPLLAYHEHNAPRMRPRILEHLEAGEAIALVSDAGTPLVSDPGYKLVRDCVAREIPVTGLPGPSSVLAALVLSGLPSDRFLFAGFLPSKAGGRRKALGEIAGLNATLIFLESAKRLPTALAAMAEALPGREAAVARELTKLFEEVRRGPLDDLAAHYAEAGPPKGEVVVVVGPPSGEGAEAEVDLDALLAEAMAGASLRDAVAAVTARTGLARHRVYERALALKKAQENGG